MRIKPTHLKLAAAVLQDGDFADATEAAKAVINEIDRLRSEDITYVAVREYNGPTYMAYGPFPTWDAAHKAAVTGRVGIPGYGLLAIVPVRSYESQQARLASLDDLGDHVKGSHWARVQERVGG